VIMSGDNINDELLDHLNKIKRLYCENDFLIPSSSVHSLVFRYQEMMLVSERLQASTDHLTSVLKCQDNGFTSLETVKTKLVDISIIKARNIISKVANVSTVNKFLTFWTKSFSTMTTILETALQVFNINPQGVLFPAKPDCRSEEIMEISQKIINIDVSCFYGELQSFHLRGDCAFFTRCLHSFMLFYCDNLELNLTSLKKVLHSLRCLTDREMMADKVINISREVNILSMVKPVLELSSSRMELSSSMLWPGGSNLWLCGSGVGTINVGVQSRFFAQDSETV